MKIKMNFLVAFIATFGIASMAQSQDFSYTLQGGQTLYFNIVDGGAVVTRPEDTTLPYYSQLGNLEIPSVVTYNNVDYTVTAIDSNAFNGCTGLTSVTIPSTITSIGRRAFAYVSDLTRTNYSGSLAEWCTIFFGSASSSPAYVSGNLFIGGSPVTVASLNAAITRIGDFAFSGLTSLYGALTLPDGLTYIGRAAFYQCTGLTSVELPESLVEMGSHVFFECHNLVSVVMPERINSIGSMAFASTGIRTVTIPRSIKNIGTNAFQDCTNLQTVYFNADSCSAGAFSNNLIYPIFGSGCTSLTNIVIGNNVKAIPDYAFSFCKRITEIVIPDSVVTIGKSSFKSCDLLASVTMGKNVQSIADTAFGWCGQLWRMILRGATPPFYGLNAFKNIASRVEVDVPCDAVVDYENNAQWGMFDIVGKVMHTLTLRVDDEAHGSVSVVEQATCANPITTVKATPLQGYIFSRWNDGNTDNPRQVNLVQDTVLTAFFDVANGLEDAERYDCKVYPQGRSVVIETNATKRVSVIDINGRVIVNANVVGKDSFVLPAAGVYFVQIDNFKTKKVIVR